VCQSRTQYDSKQFVDIANTFKVGFDLKKRLTHLWRINMVEKKKKPASASCASCPLKNSEKICLTDKGKGHKGCPTLVHKQLLEEANQLYSPEAVKHFAHMASVQEAECYANRDQKPYIMQPAKTRIVETCEFALKMGYKRLGLAFCLGLAKEAATVEEILTGYGFDVVSVCCKAGNTPKEIIDIIDDEKVMKGTDEAMCNPIFQAKMLAHEQVDFNILLGLCVGHDTLFFKFTDAPTTVLAVKDRVTGHNPLVPIYQSESYYQKIRHPEIKG
jgi:uncharacterized metal-binding protein